MVLPGAALAPTAASASSEDDPVIFTVGLTNEVDSFNPFLGIEAESFEMWALTYDYLISYSMDDMSPQPGLATEWETSEDGLTWTFKIRDDVVFSDGEPLTSADVKFTLDRVLDGGPEAATWGSYLTGVESAEAPDDTTVVLTLSAPNAVLPLIPIPIVPEHIWKDIPENEVKSYGNEPTDGQPVVGSGPFRLVEGTAGGSTYRFEANPDYWKGAPHIDEVVYRVFKSEDPAVQALIKGEIDFVSEISALQVKALEGREGIIAHNGDSPGFDEIAFNTGSVDLETGEPIGDPNPAVLDAKFRFALNFAIDRERLIEAAYQGGGQPGTTIIPPAYPDFHWEPDDPEAFAYDPDKAAQLLDEAGYTMGDDGLRTLPNGDPIGTLRLAARSDSQTSVDVMDFFKEWLADIGIDAEVTAYESSKLTNVILDGEFDTFEWGWFVEPDPDSMLSYMTCGQRGNWSDSWLCNEDYDALYEAQHVENDDAARADMVKQMQEILYNEAPYLVTAYSSIGEAFRSDRFGCFQPQPAPGGIWIQQYGSQNYLNVRPAAEAGDCDGLPNVVGTAEESGGGDGNGEEGSGAGTGLLIGLGVAAGVGVVGGAVFLMRRRASADERE
ncbi:ABC transporter substrate-binding protein [Nocardioides bigeumensis]|uniref:ABC transporter substrate-binding protein n=2 Tax=Nocardioides bigeumensis TaxID=433657 RepID=A0ABP5JLE0_9ACTN